VVVVSNLETTPLELQCDGHARAPAATGRPAVQVLTPREVPLGGPRAITVRRTLPQRDRSLIGGWCFADHYGPDNVAVTGGMNVAPHPHTGLQTVSWLFTGEIEHRDSLGVHAMVCPGELNLMTGGHGICHSEVSTPDTTILHGVQLWVALPDASRHTPRDFQHYTPTLAHLDGARLRVFVGALAGQTSPVRTFSPLLGAEITLDARAQFTLDVDPSFEHGLLVDIGTIRVAGTEVPRAALAYLGAERTRMTLTNLTDAPARGLLLGGQPLGEEIVMWWNFVARSHDEIVAYRQAWQDESDQFGRVDGYRGSLRRLPAPPLPTTRLMPRRNPGNPHRT
jgi:hypothetical protein